MPGWLKRWLSPASAEPLAGAPKVRRQKTYSGQSGFVYQYFYEGQRACRRGRAEGTEFVFSVTAGRGGYFPVSVWLGAAAIQDWELKHGRSLRSNERYAIAKMSLFQAFDEREHPDRLRDTILLDALGVAAMLAALDIE